MRAHILQLHPLIRRLTKIALPCLAMLALGTSAADAATYHSFLCRVPYGPAAGAVAPTDGMTYGTNGSYVTAGQNCAPGGTIYAVMDGGTTHPFGHTAFAKFSAPSGLTVAGFSVWRYTAVGPVQTFGAPVTNLSYTGAISVEGLCAQSLGCTSLGTTAQPLAPQNLVSVPNLSGVTSVTWDATCGGGEGGTCPASGPGTFSAAYSVFAADMLLNDPTPPAVRDVGGPLLGAGTLSGAQSVSFNATDSGSGIHKGLLVVDGAVVSETVLDANGGACRDLGVAPDGRPSFVNTQPCPTSLSGLLTLNTDALSPGAHALTVRVSDAAGNQHVAATSTISVVGSLPPGTPNGTSASRAAKLSARFASNGKRTRRLGTRTRPTITGQLADAAGKPIVAAAVQVLVRQRRAGARSTQVATPLTGNDGRFRVQLPPGPSRTITVRYTAFSGDAKPAASLKLNALVRAQLSASMSPRSVSLRQLTRMTGRLSHLRRGGVEVAIQSRDGRVWKTIHTTKTSRDGRFRWSYRFRNPISRHRTYFFRARVSSPIYPFAPGNSRAMAIRVR